MRYFQLLTPLAFAVFASCSSQASDSSSANLSCTSGASGDQGCQSEFGGDWECSAAGTCEQATAGSPDGSLPLADASLVDASFPTPDAGAPSSDGGSLAGPSYQFNFRIEVQENSQMVEGLSDPKLGFYCRDSIIGGFSSYQLISQILDTAYPTSSLGDIAEGTLEITLNDASLQFTSPQGVSAVAIDSTEAGIISHLETVGFWSFTMTAPITASQISEFQAMGFIVNTQLVEGFPTAQMHGSYAAWLLLLERPDLVEVYCGPPSF